MGYELHKPSIQNSNSKHDELFKTTRKVGAKIENESYRSSFHIGSVIASAAGGTLIGSTFGPIGSLIGIVSGTAIGIGVVVGSNIHSGNNDTDGASS